MLKKNLAFILILVLTLLLIVLVIWRYEKRMQELSKRMHQSFTLVTKHCTYHQL